MPKLSHNDNPALTDSLNQSSFIDNICNVILDCTPPKGIGINGYWGTGKTTTLMRLYHQFSGEHPYGKKFKETAKYEKEEIIPIWFEAWRYQHESLPIVALLNEIRSQLGRWEKIKNEAGKLLGVSVFGAIKIIDEVIKAASGGINSDLAGIKGIGESWEKERYQNQLSSQVINQLLEEAIKELSGENYRLVIFIDDLDRCSPDKALQLMEGIKVYLNLSNCITVFGMDQRQVEQALLKANEGYFKPHQAKEYLEKICQDIYRIPLPDQEVKTKFFIKLLKQLNKNIHYRRMEKHINQFNKILLQYDCLPANPRKIKALVNRIGVKLRHCDMTNTDCIKKGGVRRDYALLISIVIFHTFYREVYEQLQKNHGFISDIISYAQGDEFPLNADSNTVDIKNLPNKYEPMKEIVPSYANGDALTTNPSDSNVFRLHSLLIDLDTVTTDEVECLMKGGV